MTKKKKPAPTGQPISIRLPAELIDELDACCVEFKLKSRSDAIQRLIGSNPRGALLMQKMWQARMERERESHAILTFGEFRKEHLGWENDIRTKVK